MTPLAPIYARSCPAQHEHEFAYYPKKRNGLAENMPGEGKGKASASERPYGGSLRLWQPHLSTAEAACRTRWGRPECEVQGAGGRLFQEGKQRRTEEKLCIIVKYNNN